MLPLDTFLRVVDTTPLIAIDLIVPNEDGGYLLGHRVNRSAYRWAAADEIVVDHTVHPNTQAYFSAVAAR
ncbi:putative gDP-mannose mannosyl hydrolase [Burkholderia cenocepacia]|uniref:GDP-mannose mannosyl hydrolase n=1 Tax=Burkholderia cenocepacia TaxID=95486 RepID=A0AAN0VKD3_9BURK|nr:putative gDP-mannose mannosyl hydrolase [Burkholderia cenocepacia]